MHSLHLIKLFLKSIFVKFKLKIVEKMYYETLQSKRLVLGAVAEIKNIVRSKRNPQF